jgi:hypothetical protein
MKDRVIHYTSRLLGEGLMHHSEAWSYNVCIV